MNSTLSSAYRLTASDYYALPEGPPYFQLIDGELYISPSPNRYHQQIVKAIAVPLVQHAEEGNFGQVYFAPSDVVFTPEHVFHPDIYYVSAGRAGILTVQGADGAPDLVVEILSPGTATLDLGRKREVYSECGVIEYWAVAPLTRSIDIFRFRESADRPVATLKESDTLTTSLLPGFSLSLSRVFRVA